MCCRFVYTIHHQTSNTSDTLVDNKIVDHLDVAGVLPVLEWVEITARPNEKHLRYVN